MMEVVATVASVTALVTVALQSAAQINTILIAIKDGPAEVQQLLDSVQTLETALRGTLQAAREAQKIREAYVVELHSITNRCTKTVERVKRKLINLCTKRGDGRTIKAWKFIKMVLNEKDLSKMRQELAQIYEQLGQWVGLQNLQAYYT